MKTSSPAPSNGVHLGNCFCTLLLQRPMLFPTCLNMSARTCFMCQPHLFAMKTPRLLQRPRSILCCSCLFAPRLDGQQKYASRSHVSTRNPSSPLTLQIARGFMSTGEHRLSSPLKLSNKKSHVHKWPEHTSTQVVIESLGSPLTCSCLNVNRTSNKLQVNPMPPALQNH